MPGRSTPLVSGGIYHLYNRGADKRNIFLQLHDYKRFLNTAYYYQHIGTRIRFSKYSKSSINFTIPLSSNKHLDILGYCLMPNHFHLLVRQSSEKGIAIFMSQLINSYTKSHNLKYRRVGALLQGVFKSELVETDEQFMHVLRYIHINPAVSSGVNSNFENYPWSSYQEYTGNIIGICNTEPGLKFFSNTESFQQFHRDQLDYGRKLEVIKHLIIEGGLE